MMMPTRFFFFVSVLILLSACGSSSYQKGAAQQASELDTPETWASVLEVVGDVNVGWIADFNDPTLSALVVEAQAGNKNLQTIAADVEQARALVKQAGSQLKPSLNLTSDNARSGAFEDRPAGNQFNVGLQARWELDIWGRIRSEQRAALAGAQASEAQYQFAQYSLAAGVARSYFLAIEAGLQRRIAQDTYDSLKEIERVVNVQYENGLASSQDLALSQSDLSTAEDNLVNAGGAQRDALRALEILLGRYPGADLKLQTALPQTPLPPPPGLPSEILERRPDLIAAERNVAAAFNSLDSAKAARLPTIALTSSAGGASTSLSDLLNPSNVLWTAASNLVAPLFDGGLRQSQVDSATADQKAAIAAYGDAALNAFAEVESSLDQGTVLKQRLAALQDASDKANEAYRVARLRYEEGETDLIDVLSIQQRVFSTESSLTVVRRLLLDQRVDLNLALGGSWE